VNAGVESADFPQGLADRVSFMVDSNLNSARLQVNPPQLGPIELQIAIQGNHALISMGTHSAVTRDALEAGLPTLRDMLGAQGFGEVSVDISQRSFQERSGNPQPYSSAEAFGSTRPADDAAAVSSSPSTMARISLSAVDAYA
jgi:flagellar hook-length control protein FliK